ncbi:MAG: hypothetical protein PHZ00_01270 [Candidatus Peribacteraceae bacterium]|nr:hypothetical protein [Candidatus Peribacteraceae bacterium]
MFCGVLDVLFIALFLPLQGLHLRIEHFDGEQRRLFQSEIEQLIHLLLGEFQRIFELFHLHSAFLLAVCRRGFQFLQRPFDECLRSLHLPDFLFDIILHILRMGALLLRALHRFAVMTAAQVIVLLHDAG